MALAVFPHAFTPATTGVSQGPESIIPGHDDYREGVLLDTGTLYTHTYTLPFCTSSVLSSLLCCPFKYLSPLHQKNEAQPCLASKYPPMPRCAYAKQWLPSHPIPGIE